MNKPLVEEISDDIIEAAENLVQVQVASIDPETGEMLGTVWMVPENHFDVCEKIQLLFGKPIGDMSISIPAAVPAMAMLMTDENTHFQIGESDG